MEPRRLLILRLGAVGDVVRCLPSLEALRRWLPSARICWLAEPGPAALLTGYPGLDRLFVFRRAQARLPWSAAVRDTLRDLRREAFDVTLDFHGILKSALFALASGAPRRVAFGPPLSREMSHLLATETLPDAGLVWRPAQFLALAAAAAGRSGNEGLSPLPGVRLPMREPERDRMRAWVEKREPAGRRLVVVYPGSSPGARWKRWPPDRYAHLARRLAATGAIEVIVAWGPGEEELARRAAGSGAEHVHLAPPTSLPELVELLRGAELFVGADTGPTHIAAALGVPVLGIYGPSDVERNRPLGSGHVLLSAGRASRTRPWNRGEMARATAEIPAEQVYEEAARMLRLS